MTERTGREQVAQREQHTDAPNNDLAGEGQKGMTKEAES